MIQDIWSALWNPVLDVVFIIDDIIKLIPYPLLFLIGILSVQACFAIDVAFATDAASATRQLLHGAFLDLHGILWTLGIASGLVTWAAASKALDARSERRSRRRSHPGPLPRDRR
ncbi:hypothetical protein J2T07_002166 [Luteibacter jiangsuensis]|uniref:Uncharacterized protein n=1 Tax=Luteibacter jiangsuensis TaxID=637577 RepID=A0ABT9SYA2_9GAMM|nr:hypothetical protein [Luteibacter jiangsuensis]MDQ0009976.1 hypothetical protein [Luteibacter jiangsuensis]